jgi:hypothetical protein
VADWKEVFDSNASNPEKPASAGGVWFAVGSGKDVDVALGENVVVVGENDVVVGTTAGDWSSAEANSAASRKY